MIAPTGDLAPQRFVVEYTPKHAVHSAARAAGWKLWSDQPASRYVDPCAFTRVKICDSLADALSFAQDLCVRGANYFDAASVLCEVRTRDDWRPIRAWTVTALGAVDARGKEVVS